VQAVTKTTQDSVVMIMSSGENQMLEAVVSLLPSAPGIVQHMPEKSLLHLRNRVIPCVR